MTVKAASFLKSSGGVMNGGWRMGRVKTCPEWHSVKDMHRGFCMIGANVETSFIANHDNPTAHPTAL